MHGSNFSLTVTKR